eukprot:UN03535
MFALLLFIILVCIWIYMFRDTRLVKNSWAYTSYDAYVDSCEAIVDYKLAMYQPWFAPELYLQHLAYERWERIRKSGNIPDICHPSQCECPLILLHCGHLYCKNQLEYWEYVRDTNWPCNAKNNNSRYLFNVNYCVWCAEPYTPNLRWTHDKMRGKELKEMIVSGYGRNIERKYLKTHIPTDINSIIQSYY